jgi:hypothetical protein
VSTTVLLWGVLARASKLRRSEAVGSALRFAPWKSDPSAGRLTVRRGWGVPDGGKASARQRDYVTAWDETAPPPIGTAPGPL